MTFRNTAESFCVVGFLIVLALKQWVKKSKSITLRVCNSFKKLVWRINFESKLVSKREVKSLNKRFYATEDYLECKMNKSREKNVIGIFQLYWFQLLLKYIEQVKDYDRLGKSMGINNWKKKIFEIFLILL